MSERDFQLKLRTARWFWSMGSAVALRVRLTTYAGDASAKPRRRGSGLTDLADLDVLGVHVGPDFTAHYRAAECKSAKAGAKELFWLRGVLDYFGGGDGYLIVQHDKVRSPGLRELAGRIGLGIVTYNDFEAIEAAYPTDPVADVLFDPGTVSRADGMLQQPAKGLERLTDYALRFSWQLPQHRNLQQAVGYLRGASDALRPDQREHVLLFGEVVWRYLLALYGLGSSVIRRGYPHVRPVALAYLHGGELGLHEAQQRVRAVQNLQNLLEGGERLDLAGVFSEAPPYFDALLDVLERFLRRPALAGDAMRELAVGLYGVVVAERSARDLPRTADPIAAKLVNDVAAFLTRAAGLDRGLRDQLADALEVRTDPGAETGNREPARTAGAEELSVSSPSRDGTPSEDASDTASQLRITTPADT